MCVEKKFATEYSTGEEALKFIKPGTAFACNRQNILDHYGIFIGWIDDIPIAIHFSGEVLSDTCIRFQHFLEVVSNSKVRVFGCSGIKNPFQLIGGTSCDPAKVIQRALDRLGEGNYHFATWNCESYVNWVYYNIGISSQSLKAAPGAVIVAGVIAANPLPALLGGRLAKNFLESSIRTNPEEFKKAQEEVKLAIKLILDSKGADGLQKH